MIWLSDRLGDDMNNFILSDVNALVLETCKKRKRMSHVMKSGSREVDYHTLVLPTFVLVLPAAVVTISQNLSDATATTLLLLKNLSLDSSFFNSDRSHKAW